MLNLPPSVRIWFCMRATDMRRSFDGLSHQVREHVGEDPMSGHLFVFRNRSGDRLKILWWDRDGYAIWYKRLEKGTFSFPQADGDGASVTISTAQLMFILEGIELSSVRKKKRYTPAISLT